jgi:outer membrane lipoprotein-sorting protein
MLTALFSLFLASASAGGLPPASEILAKIDKNMVSTSRSMTVTMTNVKNGRERAFKMTIIGKGEDAAAVEYTEPAREAGTKMLRVGDELWTYMPAIEKTQKISGHMLRQGMMGTDVSYEDFVSAGDFATVYNATTLAAEDCGVTAAGALTPTSGRMCWKVEMTAKDPSVSYPKRIAWVDQEYAIAVRQELYAVSGMMLKTWTMGNIGKFGDRWFPQFMEITDKLQQGTKTNMVFSAVQFGVPTPDEVFSVRWLERSN